MNLLLSLSVTQEITDLALAPTGESVD